MTSGYLRGVNQPPPKGYGDSGQVDRAGSSLEEGGEAAGLAGYAGLYAEVLS